VDRTSSPLASRTAAPAAISPSPQDAYPPAQVALLVEQIGVKKAVLPAVPTLALGVLAGAFIAFGAMFSTLALTGSPLGFGPGRVLAGLAFSLGLVLVVIGGAELFTGNNLVVMAWAASKITTGQLLRNWALVYVANLVGALGSALMMWWSGALGLGGAGVAETAIAIAQAKVASRRPCSAASCATCWCAWRSGCPLPPMMCPERCWRSSSQYRRSWRSASSIPSPTCT
jgi:formate/nitrite transporter FocA (FNT family)